MNEFTQEKNLMCVKYVVKGSDIEMHSNIMKKIINENINDISS